jgi:hydrogenase maturation protease
VRVLVIGYGNPLRRDDGLGPRVAERIAAMLGPERLEAIACHQLTPELAEPISRAERVIFVDARLGDEPGRIAGERVIGGPATGGAFSHRADPAALLGLALELYGARPEALIVTVDGADFSYGPELSPTLAASLPAVVEHVLQLCGRESGCEVGHAGAR